MINNNNKKKKKKTTFKTNKRKKKNKIKIKLMFFLLTFTNCCLFFMFIHYSGHLKWQSEDFMLLSFFCILSNDKVLIVNF